MTKIRCLVVDDEPFGRDRVVSLLAAIPDAEVVGECDTGSEAIQAITRRSPDLVFLDVHMPDVDGFGVIEAIVRGRRCSESPMLPPACGLARYVAASHLAAHAGSAVTVRVLALSSS